jgi:radical SAM protein with 4Fe4S-binding SPASM domain
MQSVIHENYGCGAGNLVCSVSVSGDVNPCSFLGPRFNAGNLRERSIAEIWHDSQGFRSIRTLRGPEGQTAGAADRLAGFTGGCRARAQFFNGSINAPDPWCMEHEAGAEAGPDRQRGASGAEHHPLIVLEVPGGDRAR